MNLRNDRYYDPPDEPEAELCQECGHEMEEHVFSLKKLNFTSCENPFCPSKHIGVAKEMAQLLVEKEMEIEDLSSSVRMLKRKAKRFEELLDRNLELTDEVLGRINNNLSPNT